jgi:hypothetical protein
MNEEAIKAAYDLFARTGYQDTIDDFKSLISTNEDARKTAYDLFKRTGYADSFDDFNSLMGVGGVAPAPVQPLKKKEEPKPLPWAQKPVQKEAPQEPSSPLFPKQKQPEPSPLLESISGERLSAFQRQPVKPQDKVDEYIDKFPTEIVDYDEGDAVTKLEYLYGDLGFKFKEAQPGIDAVEVEAPDGSKETFSWDSFTKGGDMATSDKFKSFIKQKVKGPSNTGNLNKFYSGQINKLVNNKDVERKIKDLSVEQDEINNFIKSYNVNSKFIGDKLNTLNPSSPEYKVYQEQLKAIETQRADYESRAAKLEDNKGKINQTIGEYIDNQGKIGSYAKALGQGYTEGMGRVISGGIQIFTDFVVAPFLDARETTDVKDRFANAAELLGYSERTEADILKKYGQEKVDEIYDKATDILKKQVKYGMGTLEMARKAPSEVYGPSGISEEYLEDFKSTFVGGSLYGVASSLPALLSGGGATARTLNFVSQNLDFTTEVMESNPELSKLSENEKNMVKAPIAIAVGVLEEFGLRNVIAQKGVLNGIIARALGKSAQAGTTRSFAEFVKQDVESMVARGLLTATAGAAAEFETGALQELADIGVKEIYNEIKGKEMFKELPKNAGEYLGRMAYAGAQEAVGGFVMGVPGAVSSAYRKQGFEGMSDAEFSAFEDMVDDEKIESAFVTRLKAQANAGDISVAEAKEQLNDYRNARALYQQIPTGLSMGDTKKAMNLLKKRNELSKSIEGKDEALTKKQREQIKEINIELEQLNEQEDAVQEQTTSEVPIQPEARVGEEVAQGTPQAEPEVATEEEVIEEADAVTIGQELQNPAGVYTYDGYTGQLALYDQMVVLETPTQIIDIGNVDEISESTLDDFGIVKEEEMDINVNDDNSVTIKGETYQNNYSDPLASINKDKDGNYSVTLDTKDGQKRTFRGQRAQEIVYQYTLKQFEQNAEQQIDEAERLADEAIATEREIQSAAPKRKDKAVRKANRKTKQRTLKSPSKITRIEEVAPSPVETAPAPVQEVTPASAPEKRKETPKYEYEPDFNDPIQESIDESNMALLMKVTERKKIKIGAEPMITIFGDKVYVEYNNFDKDNSATRIIFNQDKNGKWGKVDKIERKAMPIRNTVFFDNYVKDLESEAAPAPVPAPEQETKEQKAPAKEAKAAPKKPAPAKEKAPTKEEKAPAKEDKKLSKLKEEADRIQKDIDYNEFQVEDLEEELRNTEYNRRTDTEEVKKEIAELKKKKPERIKKKKEELEKSGLSKEEVSEAMYEFKEQLKEEEEDLKAKIDQINEDNDDYRDGYKDEIKEAKAELKKLNKQLEKKNAEIAAREEAPSYAIIDKLDNNTTLEAALGYLEDLEKDLDEFSKGNLSMGIAIPTLKLMIKATKALVKGGIKIQDALTQVAAQYNVTKQEFMDAIKGLHAKTTALADMKQEIKDEIQSFRQGKMDINQKRAALAKLINAMKQKGSINTRQARTLLNRISKVNLDNQAQVDNFINYATNVFNNAEYDQYISTLASKLPRAKVNVEKKIGEAKNLTPLLRKVFSIKPSLIPATALYEYGSLVEAFSKSAAVLPLDDINTVTQLAQTVLDEVDKDISTIPGLTAKFYATQNTVMGPNNSVLYGETLNAMQKAGEITDAEKELMKKYKNEILPPPSNLKPSAQQLQQEKDDAINEIINNVKIRSVGLTSRLEQDLAISIGRLIKNRAILERLSINELNNIIALADNIENGFLPAIANTINNRLIVIKNAIPVSKGIESAKLTIKSKLYNNFINTSDAVMKSFKNNPLRLIDEMFGNFKSRPLYEGMFENLAEMYTSYETRLNKINTKLDVALDKVSKSLKRSENALAESKMRMALYRIQREYNSNPGDPRVHPAVKYIDAILKEIPKGNIMYNERDGKVLERIKKDFNMENGDPKDVQDALEKSFNSAEKAALKVFDEVNKEIEEYAIFTADVIRNNKITLLNDYNHLVSISHGSNNIDYVGQALGKFNKQGISTKSVALLERGITPTPVNLDIFSTVQSGAKSVLLDYYMTDAVRQARGTLNEAEKISTENNAMDGKNQAIYGAMDKAVEQVLENVLTNSYAMDSMSEQVLKFIQKMGYKSMLASVPRTAAEFASNMSYIFSAGRKDFATGIKNLDVIRGATAGDVMTNLKSAATTRVLGKEGLSGRALDSNLNNRVLGMKRTQTNSEVVDKAMQIYNLTLKRYSGGVDTLASNLITVSDKIMLRPLWFGAFANQFKKITGTDVDFNKIADNDQAYMRQYESELAEARKIADEKTAMAGSTSNPFMSAIGRQINAKDSGFKKFVKTFDNFMNQFVINEWFVFRRAVYELLTREKLTLGQASGLLAGVLLRSSLYFTLSKIIGNAFIGMMMSAFGLEDEDDEEEKDDKTMAQALGQGFASAATTLILGQNLGNISRSAVNYGVEKVNENYFDF